MPPKPGGGAPTPRVSNPRRKGGPWGGAPAHMGLVPLPLQPMGPSGIGGPTRWTPGTLSGGPGTIPATPKLVPMAEMLGNVVISKKFLRTLEIMVMHSNERGEYDLRTLVDRNGIVDTT